MSSEEEHVELYIVEIVYNDTDEFEVSEEEHPQHLQIRAHEKECLWHKEAMINLGVRTLLPSTWKAFAWIDADLSFENLTWSTDTLRLLNGFCDIVQLFSHCCDLNQYGVPMQTFSSFGFNYFNQHPYTAKGHNFFHPGYAFAMTRKAYEYIGGLYEHAIVGAGDNMMAFSLINCVHKSITFSDITIDYQKHLEEFQKRMKFLRLAYTPGVIKHYFHGSKINRQYNNRGMILVHHQYSPTKDTIYNDKGLLVLKRDREELIQNIRTYFDLRHEDSN